MAPVGGRPGIKRGLVVGGRMRLNYLAGGYVAAPGSGGRRRFVLCSDKKDRICLVR